MPYRIFVYMFPPQDNVASSCLGHGVPFQTLQTTTYISGTEFVSGALHPMGAATHQHLGVNAAFTIAVDDVHGLHIGGCMG